MILQMMIEIVRAGDYEGKSDGSGKLNGCLCI